MFIRESSVERNGRSGWAAHSKSSSPHLVVVELENLAPGTACYAITYSIRHCFMARPGYSLKVMDC